MHRAVCVGALAHTPRRRIALARPLDPRRNHDYEPNSFQRRLPAMAGVSVMLNFGPPVAVVEVVPGPRQGYVWSPGYYSYTNERHVWLRSEAVREREGYAYQPSRRVERDGRWNLERSHWERK